MGNTFRNFVLIALVGLMGCSQETVTPEDTAARPDPAEMPEIVASSSIICDLTRQIAAETLDIQCLIGPQQDPHTYTTKPSDRQALETADLVLYGGYGFETALEGLIAAVDTASPKVAVFEQAVSEPIMTEPHDHSHGEEGHSHDHSHGEESHSHDHSHGEEGHSHDHSHGEEGHSHDNQKEEMAADPHVWLDVENAIATAKIIQQQLGNLNPEASDTYTENTATLIADLERLDLWIAEQVATVPENQRIVMSTHDAFNYFTQAYDFQDSQALQGLSTEETPTAAQVKVLVTAIETAKVPAIFAEANTNNGAIATVAREANVKVATPALLTGGLGDTANYTDMMVLNTCTIVNHLGGNCTPPEG